MSKSEGAYYCLSPDAGLLNTIGGAYCLKAKAAIQARQHAQNAYMLLY